MIINNEFSKQGETRNINSVLGIVRTWISKTIKADTTVDTDGKYIIKKDSLANSEILDSGWMNVEEYDSYFISAISTDTGTLKILFSDGSGVGGNTAPPDDNNTNDGDSIGLTANQFVKIGGVAGNQGELVGNINYKWMKIKYEATSTASGKPVRVYCLLVR